MFDASSASCANLKLESEQDQRSASVLDNALCFACHYHLTTNLYVPTFIHLSDEPGRRPFLPLAPGAHVCSGRHAGIVPTEKHTFHVSVGCIRQWLSAALSLRGKSGSPLFTLHGCRPVNRTRGQFQHGSTFHVQVTPPPPPFYNKKKNMLRWINLFINMSLFVIWMSAHTVTCWVSLLSDGECLQLCFFPPQYSVYGYI